jgi:hypothetical protein
MQVATRLSRFKSPIELYMEKMDKSTFIVPPNESMWEYLGKSKTYWWRDVADRIGRFY